MGQPPAGSSRTGEYTPTTNSLCPWAGPWVPPRQGGRRLNPLGCSSVPAAQMPMAKEGAKAERAAVPQKLRGERL